MYPLNLILRAAAMGFAVANDEAEHIALTEQGYEPAFVTPVSPVEATYDRTALMEQAAAKGLAVDGRWSDKRLTEELAKV